MNTTWYLQSHFVWLRLCCSSIDEVSSRVLGCSQLEASSVGRLPEMSNCYCHPGRAGGSLGYSRNHKLASAPLLSKFVSGRAAMYHELRKRGTSLARFSLKWRTAMSRLHLSRLARLAGEVDLWRCRASIEGFKTAQSSRHLRRRHVPPCH